MDQGRGTKRYPTNQELLVRCDTWGEFVALYATDVGQGGMFIVTDDAPPVLSEVEVQLRLPEGHQIRMRARVVHVIEPAQAAHARREPGVGVEFIGLDAPTRAQIHQLVEFARWQGTSTSPTATFASHMFEMNASAPPASVMASLPPADSSRSGVRRASSSPAASGTPGSERSRPVSTGSMPAVVPPGASAAPKKKKKSSAPPGGADSQPVQADAAQSGQPAAAPPPPPPKPTDMEELKVGMTHLARKRFPEAVKHFQTMLANNPGDPEVGKWLHVTNARRALASNDEKAAKAAYEKALAISEDVLEARKFVREMEQRKKLEAIPFGRYFVKKKP